MFSPLQNFEAFFHAQSDSFVLALSFNVVVDCLKGVGINTERDLN